MLLPPLICLYFRDSAHAHLPHTSFQEINSIQAVLLLILVSSISDRVKRCKEIPSAITLQDTYVIARNRASCASLGFRKT